MSNIWGQTQIMEQNIDPIILGIAVGITKRAAATETEMDRRMHQIQKELNEKLIGDWRCENGISFIQMPDRSKKQHIYLKVDNCIFFIYESTDQSDVKHQHHKSNQTPTRNI